MEIGGVGNGLCSGLIWTRDISIFAKKKYK